MADKLQTAFENHAKEGKIALDCIKRWFKEAAVTGKETGITDADVDAAVAKISKDQKGLDYAGLKECINALAKEKKVEPKVLMEKLARAGVKCIKQGPAAAAGGKATKDVKEK